MARRKTARPAPAWAGDLPVFERTLPNGLKALALPRGQAPVVVCDLYYPVGSVDEPAGQSGLAHFLEHMLFKGTERFPKGQLDRLVFAAAGHANAETSEDFTRYWFALPADRWELALALEADRMRGALLDPGEFESERQVIAEERARELDSPLGRLDQTHLTVSYLRHPYRNPILGWPDDLQRLDVATLRAFYRAHYRPDGAVLVLVGSLDPERALDRVEAHFRDLPAGDVPRPLPRFVEPRQSGRRDFALVEPESVARGLFGWHSVPQGHADGPALSVLADILTCGRRSRLWDRLVERDRLATWLDAAHEPARLAGQFLFQVEAAPGTDPAAIERVAAEEIARLADEGPQPEELARSRRRLEAAWRWEQEDLSGLAGGLGQVALWDDWRVWQAEHRAAIAVADDDIRRVASAYLSDQNLTVGWSLPRPERAMTVLLPAELTSRPSAVPELPALTVPAIEDRSVAPYLAGVAARLADYRPGRDVLPNGLRLLSERRPGAGIVVLELYADAGLLREEKPGLAYLTGRMLDEGAGGRSAEELAEAIEDVGGSLEVGSTGVALRVRAEDLPLAVELMADLVLRPALPAEALAWARRRVAAELQGDRDEPAFRAEQVFRSLVYGDHPYGRDARGSARELARITLDDVKAHHARYFRPDNAFIVAAGDFEPRALKALIARRFRGWEPGGVVHRRPPRPVRPVRPRVRRLFHPSAQVQIVLGHLGIPRNHPDYEALVVLDHILGSGPGFTDRLSHLLRDEMGLTYSVSGGITDTADVEPGLFQVQLGTNPEDVERAVAAVVDQIRAMHEGSFADAEVEQARRYLAGAWVFDYQTVDQRADRLIEIERWGLGLDEPLTWPGRIERVTPRQVRKAARTHLDPAALARVELGPVKRRGQRAGAACA